MPGAQGTEAGAQGAEAGAQGAEEGARVPKVRAGTISVDEARAPREGQGPGN